MAKDTLKQYVVLRQELLEEKKQLEERLNEIDLVLKGTDTVLPVGKTTGKRRGRPPGKVKAKPGRKAGTRAKGGITTNDAILKALEDGAQKDITTITSEVEKLKGKVSKPSISIGLAKLKKEGKIKNPERGFYAKA